MLPNFMCIGAQKSGTTTIWHILETHPQVFLAQPRETRFFYEQTQFDAGLHRYEITYFSTWAGQVAVGEKCPEYLFVPEVANRLYQALGPNLKLIVTLRSPAQRAFSHYRHNFFMLQEDRSFEEALETEAANLQRGKTIKPLFGYLARGFYARQLKRYFEIFAPKQFLIVNFEQDIVSDQRDLASRLFDFLELEQFCPIGLPIKQGHPQLENLSVKLNLNKKDSQENFVEIERRSLKLQPIKRWFRFLKQRRLAKIDHQTSRIHNPSDTLIQFARGFNTHKPKMMHLPRQQEIAINNSFFKGDIKSLQSLVPFTIDHWLADP